MQFLETLSDLEALYGSPSEAARVKVTPVLIPAYSAFIARSRFCILSTVGAEGTDASPRGDDGPVVAELDPATLAMPDWRGNERIDSLRNIVTDGRVSLMFFVPGSSTVIRVNGRGKITTDDALRERFARDDKLPRTVLVVAIKEAYPQCARAVMRSALWTSGDQSQGLPSIGEMLREATQGAFDAQAYDAAWPGRAAASMW
jgi:PPOX class probable FMN-dependent enzyme